MMNEGGTKKIISLALILCLTFQLFLKLGYVVNYAVNKNYIAKNLCENRGKPKMNCNGKCHLKKQLKAAEKNESQGKTDSKEKWEDLFCTSAFELNLPALAFLPQYFYENTLLPNNFKGAVFHPPCA